MIRNWNAVIREPESGYAVVSCSRVIALLGRFSHSEIEVGSMDLPTASTEYQGDRGSPVTDHGRKHAGDATCWIYDIEMWLCQ